LEMPHHSHLFLSEYCLQWLRASMPPSMIPKRSSSEDPPLVQNRKKAHHRKTRPLIPSLVPTSRFCAVRADLSHQLRSIRDRLTDTGFAESNATEAKPACNRCTTTGTVSYRLVCSGLSTFQAGIAMDMHLPSTIGCAGDFVSPRTHFSNHFA